MIVGVMILKSSSCGGVMWCRSWIKARMASACLGMRAVSLLTMRTAPT